MYTLFLKMFKFSKGGLWTLFLVSAFPVHVWTILLVLRDFSWVSERTNAWDAVGVGAYGLLIALTESLVVFGGSVFLGVLVRGPWPENRRVALLSILILIVSGWAMINQAYFLTGQAIPQMVFQFLISHGHPLRIIYITALLFVVPSVFIPIYLILKSERVVQFIHNVIDRINLLTALYLVLDAGAFIIVVVRNL